MHQNQGYIRLIQSNCKNCHKCIQRCPVKSIRFSSGKAEIIADECLLCGQCYVACPQNAKEIRSDIEPVKAHFAAKETVYASLAPSFAANYKGATIASMRKALKQLGFSAVEETAIGATIVKTRYEQLIAEGGDEHGVLISSCCPVINDFISLHKPDALPYLADVVTPIEAHCRKIKQEHPEAITVFIGPCIAKKRESDRSKYIDHALTFDELTRWMNNEGVMLTPIPDTEENSRARLFPTSDGVLRTMFKNPNWSYVTVDGMDNCRRAIKEIIKGELKNVFVEMSACAGSCVCGPVMERMRDTPIANNAAINAYAGKKDFVVEQPDPATLHESHDDLKIRKVHISEETIKKTLLQMGKTSPDQELNCGFCGYDTCRDKAIAICMDKAQIDMCLPYLMEKAQSFSDIIIKYSPTGVIVLNESLEIQQLNDIACEIMNIKDRKDLYGEQLVTILDPRPVLDVVQLNKTVRNQSMYLSEYRRYVEESVIYNKNYHIIIVFLRDVTSQEAARSHRESVSSNTIEVADEVIDNQMRVVQEIASLLGETAAQTKIALTKLKESLQDNE